ncbi:MAG: hypothetical protein AAF242_02795, partial [Bacteroidota bacterium]
KPGIMKHLITLLALSFLFLGNTYAQPDGSDKLSGALQEFMQTEFMRKYNDLKIKAESEITAFIGTSSGYDPNDVARVQVAYDRTAQRFNGLLEKIKADFMDSQKLKYITKFPESYSRGLELDIRELSDFYSAELQQTLADVTGNQQDGSALLVLLIDLVKFSSSAIQHFKRIRQEARRYNDSYLNRHFIQPNRFKTWAELSGNGTYQNDIYNDPYNQNTTDPYSDPYNQNTTTDPYSDPYNQNTTTDPYQQQNTTDPYNQNTTNPYNTDPYQNQNQNDPYNFDGASKSDSLSKFYPVDSTKLKKQDSIYIKPAPKDQKNLKSQQTYQQYKAKQKAIIKKKQEGTTKTKKNN